MIRPASRSIARRRRRPPASAAQEDPDLTPPTRSALRSPLSWGQLVVWLLAALALALVLAPVGALIARGITQADIGAALTSPFVRAAVQLSLVTSVIAVVAIVALGTPTAYLLARRRFPGRVLVDAVIDLPIVLPPVVGGLALLLLLGRQGPVGGTLDGAGIDVAFTTAAVVLAQMFVAAPFYIRAARAGFESVDQRLEAVSSPRRPPLAHVSSHYRPARPPLAGRRRRHGLGARLGRVRRHHHVCGQRRRPNPDHAARDPGSHGS